MDAILGKQDIRFRMRDTAREQAWWERPHDMPGTERFILSGGSDRANRLAKSTGSSGKPNRPVGQKTTFFTLNPAT